MRLALCLPAEVVDFKRKRALCGKHFSLKVLGMLNLLVESFKFYFAMRHALCAMRRS
jgi:hypothetical protein